MSKEVKEALKVLEAATANCAQGDRHIAVLDRGWIFAGNMSLDKETGVYTMTNCANIRRWTKGGFGAVTQSVKESGATLDKCATIKFHARAMILCVPIGSDWDE